MIKAPTPISDSAKSHELGNLLQVSPAQRNVLSRARNFLFAGGIVTSDVLNRRVTAVHRWGDISELFLDRVCDVSYDKTAGAITSRTRHHYQATFTDSSEVAFRVSEPRIHTPLEDYAHFGPRAEERLSTASRVTSAIETTATTELITKVRDAFQAGEPIQFGRFNVCSDSLTYGEDTYTPDQVISLRIADPKPAQLSSLWQTPQQTLHSTVELVYRDHNDQEQSAHSPLGQVPNAGALVELWNRVY